MVMSLWPRFFVPPCIYPLLVYDDIKLMVCLVSVSSVVRCVESTFAELFLQNRGFRTGADPGSWPLSGSRVNMAAGMFLFTVKLLVLFVAATRFTVLFTARYR